MIYIISGSLLITIIALMVMNISMLISKKMKINNEKMSPFECGFNLISNARMPFSLRFFLITIIFLIFDIEIAIIMPMIYTILSSNTIMWTITLFIFILILLLGIMHEWNQGALNWM